MKSIRQHSPDQRYRIGNGFHEDTNTDNAAVAYVSSHTPRRPMLEAPYNHGHYNSSSEHTPSTATISHVAQQNITAAPYALPRPPQHSFQEVTHSESAIPKQEGAEQASGFSLAKLGKMANMTEIKRVVDRMGGLDGILTTVTKAQKIMTSVSQMAPLVKVFFGSFGSKNSEDSSSSFSEAPAQRRRRRRTNRPIQRTGSRSNQRPIRRASTTSSSASRPLTYQRINKSTPQAIARKKRTR